MSQWNVLVAPNKWPDVFLLLSLEEDLVSKLPFTMFPSMSLGWAVGPEHLRPVGCCWAGNQPFWTGFLNLIQMSPGYHFLLPPPPPYWPRCHIPHAVQGQPPKGLCGAPSAQDGSSPLIPHQAPVWGQNSISSCPGVPLSAAGLSCGLKPGRV